MNRSEADLSRLLASDLNRHFPQLVLAYQHRLFSFALRQTGSRQDAEDIVQEALIRAYYALGDYPAERILTMKLQAWLYKITLNCYYNRVRGMRLNIISLDTSEECSTLEIEDDWREQPELVLEDNEQVRALSQLVTTLPEQYRAAISLYYFEDLSYREIAELLNQPMGTVKANLHRGTRLLRQLLESSRNGRRNAYGA